MTMPAAITAPPAPVSGDLAALMRPVDPWQSSSAARLAVEPNAEFFLRHHPAQWDADGDGLDAVTWLPDIAPLLLVPGAHLVRTRKKGEDPGKTFEHAMNVDGNRGWVHLDPNLAIPAECLPPGVPVGGYLRAVPCKGPRTQKEGVRYLEAWNTPQQAVPGRPQRFVFDRGAYNRWRLWLVTSGIIAPPTADVIAEMCAAKAGRPARIAALPIPDDLRKQRLAVVEAKLEAERLAVVPEPAADAEAPKPKKARKGTL